MSDLMREEFESAMSLETGLSIELFELDRNGDSYLSTGPKYAWWAWQASRESVEIEIPDLIACAEDMACKFIDNIHAAGVKTK